MGAIGMFYRCDGCRKEERGSAAAGFEAPPTWWAVKGGEKPDEHGAIFDDPSVRTYCSVPCLAKGEQEREARLQGREE